MTRTADAAVPPGYEAVTVGAARAVALHAVAPAVRAALEAHGSLYAHARAQPGRRELRGRAAAYGIALGDVDVVVRHSWHGGALAALTRDLFVAPTRAPRELATSERLRALGVRTPEVAAYVRHAGPLGLERADVATRLVAGGFDLADAIRVLPPRADPTGGWVRATGALLHALAHAGAHHPDLNLKNVLLVPRDGADPMDASAAWDAWVLDVDVMRVDDAPPDGGRAWAIGERNLARLLRSIEKWRTRRALPVREVDLSALQTIARHGPEATVELVWRPGHNVGPT